MKDCVAFGRTPLTALNVIVYGPPAAGFPAKRPLAGLKVTPLGSPVAESVGAGRPVAATVKLLDPLVAKVALLALVKTGALFRVSVKFAVRGSSVGTVVAPQVPSASTAAVETLFKLMT